MLTKESEANNASAIEIGQPNKQPNKQPLRQGWERTLVREVVLERRRERCDVVPSC